MWKPKWPKTELPSFRVNTTRTPEVNSTVIKPNKRMNVNKLTSNNTRNSTSSGTRISSKPRKKMPKHLVNLKIDTPNRSRAIDRPSRKSFP